MTSQPDYSNIDPSRIPEDQWEFSGYTEDGLAAEFIFWLDKETGAHIKRKVNLVEEDLIKLNQDEYNESHSKRFGDGRVVARIPMNVFYRDFAERLKTGDKDYTKWWLNKNDNAPYRNFRGKF